MKKTDNYGNKISIYDDGVYLKLANDNYEKKIFTYRDGQLTKWVGNKHVFKKANKIGFNYYALRELLHSTRIRNIAIIYGKKQGIVKIQDILDRADFLFFKKEGFEKQVFYPLDDIKWKN